MIKAIIFDCFGVVVGKGFWDVYEIAGGNLEEDDDFIEDVLRRANTGTITREAFQAEVAARLGLSVKVWQEISNREERPNIPLLEYIRDELKPAYKIGMLSNANKGTLKERIPSQWQEIFDDIVVSGEVGMIKPDPEIFELSAKNLGIHPKEAIFTDDREQYLQGARAVGMQTILFKNVGQFIRDIRPLISKGLQL